MSKKSKKNKEIVQKRQITQDIKNTRNIMLSPLNVFRVIVIIAVVILSSLVLFGTLTESQSFQLNLANQILLSLLLLVNGVKGLKHSNKQKRAMAYTSLLLAMFLLSLTTITLLKLTILS